jgi:transcriptional regulator with XRE-family HTH domain
VPTTQYAIDENSTRDELGQALAALRSRSGITQEQLAARLGIDATYVSQVECGRRGVRWHTVMRFLSGLDSSLHQLADELEPLNDPTGG